jgi:hypothetical protein
VLFLGLCLLALALAWGSSTNSTLFVRHRHGQPLTTVQTNTTPQLHNAASKSRQCASKTSTKAIHLLLEIHPKPPDPPLDQHYQGQQYHRLANHSTARPAHNPPLAHLYNVSLRTRLDRRLLPGLARRFCLLRRRRNRCASSFSPQILPPPFAQPHLPSAHLCAALL